MTTKRKTEKKAVWQRPAVNRYRAGDAESTNGGITNDANRS